MAVGSLTGTLDQSSIDKLNSMQKNETAAEKQLKKNQAMDKDAFLNILTAQFKYQDPMNPVSDKDFIAQMAQFSTLEQTRNMADAVTKNGTTSEEMLKKLTELNDNIAKLIKNQTTSEGALKDIGTKTDSASLTQTQMLNELIKMNKTLEAYGTVPETPPTPPTTPTVTETP